MRLQASQWEFEVDQAFDLDNQRLAAHALNLPGPPPVAITVPVYDSIPNLD